MITGSRDRRIGIWLALWAVMVLLTVVIGGVTRLTESGLSITEWRPVSGVIPPVTEAQWEAEFAKYQAIPEFQIEHRDMTLPGFKRIYFWEFIHRLWARLVGVVLAVPLVVGLWQRWFSPLVRRRLVGILLLTGLQGAMGWYMVQSGLTVRTDVSQYRLAAHLSLALVIFMVALWSAADLLSGKATETSGEDRGAELRGLRGHALAATGLVFLTALAGAFVAGTNAGKVYNEYPLMAGRLVPAGYFALTPWYKNLFDNVAAVQFNHRWLAATAVLLASSLAVRLWRDAHAGSVRRLGLWVGAVALAQFALGLLTLLGSVPVTTAALHQAGAVVLLGLVLLVVHRLGAVTRP